MIPTVLILGFAAGLITGRIGALFIPLAGLAWSVGLSDPSTCDGVCGASAALLAAANAALGVGIGYAVRSAAKRISTPA